MIRDYKDGDVEEICIIYNYYIKETVITFEEVEVTPEEMLQRIQAVTENYPWFIYEENGEILGYAYATKWNTRCSYRNTTETTIYLSPYHTGKGIGKKLYKKLLSKLNSLSMHCALGGIALPNEASVKLHETLGYEKIAHFKEVGYKFGKWIDVGYWQIMLDNT